MLVRKFMGRKVFQKMPRRDEGKHETVAALCLS